MKWICALSLAAVLAACGDKESKDAPMGGAPQTKVEKAMGALDAADRALAEAQKTCPVSGEALGSMGTPVKVTTAGGKTAFLCCISCRKEFEREPAKYLAKIGK